MDARQLQRCSTSPYHEFLGERPGVDHQWESYSGAAAALKTKRLKIPLTITAAEACSTAPLFFFLSCFGLTPAHSTPAVWSAVIFEKGLQNEKHCFFNKVFLASHLQPLLFSDCHYFREGAAERIPCCSNRVRQGARAEGQTGKFICRRGQVRLPCHQWAVAASLTGRFQPDRRQVREIGGWPHLRRVYSLAPRPERPRVRARGDRYRLPCHLELDVATVPKQAEVSWR